MRISGSTVLLVVAVLGIGPFASVYAAESNREVNHEEAPPSATITAVLTAANERPLVSASGNPERECYRFIWLRSFHAPVVLRLEVRSGRGCLYIKVLSRFESGKPYQLVRSEEKNVSRDDLLLFRALFRKTDFWNRISSRSEERGVDGATWNYEVRLGERYRLVERWSPKDDAFANWGRFWIETAIGGDLVPIY